MQVIHQPYHQGRLYTEKHLVALVLADIHNLVPELLKCSPASVKCSLTLKGTFDPTILNPEHPMTQLLLAYAQLDEFRAFELFTDKGLCPYTTLLLNSDANIHVRSRLMFKELEGQMVILVPPRYLTRIYHLWDNLCNLSKEKAFNTALNAYTRVMRERLVDYNNYVHALFARRARLLLIRIDLGYGEGNTVSYGEFRSEFDHFIELIQSNPIFSDLKGYIWTIEYGNSKGYHTHLLCFYDGSKRRSDRYIAQQIGDLWVRLSKQTNSTYFNCNTKENKRQYKECCIDEVHRDDLSAIACLHGKLIPYLLKVDEFLRLTKDDNRRLNGRGISPNKLEKESEDEFEFNGMRPLQIDR